MKKNKCLFYVSCICYLFSAVTVFLLPYSRLAGTADLTGTGYLMGVLFWIGIFLGTGLHITNWYSMKNSEKYVKYTKKRSPGLFGFFKTRAGMTADIALAVSFVLVVMSMMIHAIPDGIMILGMCIFLFALFMHFLLNGKVYRFIFLKDKEKERKKIYEEI